jgi:hypothetical protein
MRRQERRYERLQMASTKLLASIVVAKQLVDSRSPLTLGVKMLPLLLGMASMVDLFGQGERWERLEALVRRGDSPSSHLPAWQVRLDELAQIMLDATGWLRPVANEIDASHLERLDKAAYKIRNAGAWPVGQGAMLMEYINAASVVLEGLEGKLAQLIQPNGGRCRRWWRRQR